MPVIFHSLLSKSWNLSRMFTYGSQCYIFQIKRCVADTTKGNQPLEQQVRACHNEKPVKNIIKCYAKIPALRKCVAPAIFKLF